MFASNFYMLALLRPASVVHVEIGHIVRSTAMPQHVEDLVVLFC